MSLCAPDLARNRPGPPALQMRTPKRFTALLPAHFTALAFALAVACLFAAAPPLLRAQLAAAAQLAQAAQLSLIHI